MRSLIRRVLYFIRQRELETDLGEELHFHREMKQRELERDGMSSTDAAFAARREIGNITLAREDARAVWIWPWLESVWQDVAYALRSLRRDPGFAVVSVAVLATAIGLNTSLFTVFNAVALRPWPVKDAGRVVSVFSRSKTVVGGFSLAEARYFDQRAKTFSGVMAMRQEDVELGEDRMTAGAIFVSARFFQILGIEMERGRGFLPDEDRIDVPPAVAVVSARVWQRAFGGDDRIVGKQVLVNAVRFTIVGVAPPTFTGTTGGREDVWLPIAALPSVRPGDSGARGVLHDAGACCSTVAGRLAPGVRPDEARAELEVVSRQFHTQFGLEVNGVVVTGTAFLSNPKKRQQGLALFALMFLAVTLVLLLACANVGNLLVARAAARVREIGVRLSLGASRARVVRQLVTESLVLALAAGGVGIVLAYGLPSIIVKMLGDAPRFDFTPDATVLAYTVAIAGIASLAFGLAPALHATRGGLAGALKTTRGQADARLPLRSLLLAVQVTLCVVLLVGAGLMVRGIQHAQEKDPGFAVTGITVVSFELPARAYDPLRTRAFFADVALALTGVQGVEAGFATFEPLSNSRSRTAFRLPDAKEARPVTVLDVSAGYFRVLRIPIVAGRPFEAPDTGRPVVLVNETLARRYWPGQDPVGQTFFGGSREPVTIVGVVKDAYLVGLDQIEPMFYQPTRGSTMPKLLLRTSDAAAYAAVAAIVAGIDPRVRLQTTPLADTVDRYLVPARVGAMLAGVLGVFALSLATVGMFGVFAYVVQQRTQEIGIRMALGAQPGQVVRLVIAGSSRAVCVGLVAGLLAAALGSQLLRGFLFGVSPFDPRAYASVAAILAVAGLAATYLPARRATKVDPMTALRYE
jgi:predicted permease